MDGPFPFSKFVEFLAAHPDLPISDAPAQEIKATNGKWFDPARETRAYGQINNDGSPIIGGFAKYTDCNYIVECFCIGNE